MNGKYLVALLILCTNLLDSCHKNPHPNSKIDHSNLMVYYDKHGRQCPVRSVEDWEKRRQQILHGMQEAMGPLPVHQNDMPAFDVMVHESVMSELFERRKISLQVEWDHRVYAYLFIPVGMNPPEKVAGILALHPTHALGKGDPAGLSARKNRAYGLELAQRGYVVLAPNYPSFGDDSTYNFSTDEFVSGSMKGIFNHIRCVDYLCTLDIVDCNRLGVIGHSLGGHNAMFVAAFDNRLKVIVASCGWTPFHDYYGGNIKGWTSERYMPRLPDVYQLDPGLVPFDFYEVVAALAPRAFFSNSPLRDNNFDVNSVKKAIIEAQKIYALYHAEQMLQVHYPDCEHDFPPDIRDEAYRFIDNILNHKSKSASH